MAHALFEDLAVYIKISIDKVRRDQEKLFDITNSAYHGMVHTSIHDPHRLMEAIREISAELRGTMLPLPSTDHNLYKLLALSDLVAVFIDNILIFETSLPLIETYGFEIHKITSIPKLLEDKNIAYIKVENDLLVVSEQRDKYFFASEIQLKFNRKLISKDHYLLGTNEPVYILHARPSCETSCLTEGTHQTDLCE